MPPLPSWLRRSNPPIEPQWRRVIRRARLGGFLGQADFGPRCGFLLVDRLIQYSGEKLAVVGAQLLASQGVATAIAKVLDAAFPAPRVQKIDETD